VCAYHCFHTPPVLFTRLSVCVNVLIVRSNAVVQEQSDCFRDTVALTVRGDGVDIPPYTGLFSETVNKHFGKTLSLCPCSLREVLGSSSTFGVHSFGCHPKHVPLPP